MILCIFNPEHDLCLGNGDKNFVPPASALRFAREQAGLMAGLYGTETRCMGAMDFGPWALEDVDEVVMWGVDSRTVAVLKKAGMPEGWMPSDEMVVRVRRLQHRRESLSLQQEVDALWGDSAPSAASRMDEIEERLETEVDVVLKAPWSGAGRGLRWLRGKLSEHDRMWARKVMRQQDCVMVEPRRKVVLDYAREYWVGDDGPEYIGYSLFGTENGVYRGNTILTETQIEQRLEEASTAERVALTNSHVDAWVRAKLADCYRGPLGVDLYVDDRGLPHVGEVNLRHTMGMLAVAEARGDHGLLAQYLTKTKR